MKLIRQLRLQLPALVFGVWAVTRAFGWHGRWYAVAFLTAVALACAVAQVERKHGRRGP